MVQVTYLLTYLLAYLLAYLSVVQVGDFLTILAALAVLPFLAFCAIGLCSWRASNFVRQPVKLDRRVVSGGLTNLCASGRLEPLGLHPTTTLP